MSCITAVKTQMTIIKAQFDPIYYGNSLIMYGLVAWARFADLPTDLTKLQAQLQVVVWDI